MEKSISPCLRNTERGDVTRFFVTDGKELHILVVGYLSVGLKMRCLKHDKDRGVSRVKDIAIGCIEDIAPLLGFWRIQTTLLPSSISSAAWHSLLRCL